MMADKRLSRRVLAQLRLALLADCGCKQTLSALDLRAREAGLTGAEIDAAISGKSFEARTDAALDFACAIKLGDLERIAGAHQRALRFGVSEADLELVRNEVEAILAGQSL